MSHRHAKVSHYPTHDGFDNGVLNGHPDHTFNNRINKIRKTSFACHDELGQSVFHGGKRVFYNVLGCFCHVGYISIRALQAASETVFPIG